MAHPALPAILTQRDLSPNDLGSDPRAASVRLYAWMYLARTLDNRILELFRQGLIKGTVTGGQGHEALIVPLALLANKDTDVISFTHRGLGGHLIWSGHLVDHLNQYCANAHSPTQAREGNVHHGDPANRSLPMISHLGAMISNVLGLTDAQRRQGTAAVGFALFGDGGSSTGDIHECLNLASLLSLPIVFVVENNRYAYSTPTHEQFSPGSELWKRAAGYGMEGFALDTTSGDVAAIAATLAGLIDTVRRTSRPILIEASVVRLRGHAAYDTCDYLSASENQAIQSADPLPKFRDQLLSQGLREPLETLERELDGFIEICIQEALATPRPRPETLPADAFAQVTKPIAWQTEVPSATALTQAQALNAGLRKILRERPESMILGQDIGTYGGAFKITEGLLKEFGRPRVLNTPLAESACTGYATGLALGGMRPIEEFQFADFATEATTQIALNAATYHFRSGAKVPLVLRLPCGGGLTFGSFHSQELESLFLSVPGLKALYPSTPQDAFDALLAAYEDDNPVLLFEHKGLYRKKKQLVTWNPDYRQVWKPKRLTTGTFATLVTYGEMTLLAQEVASYFRSEYDRTIEVWDLRALAPLQLDEILSSVRQTHRLIVLHEGRRTHGFGAELVSRITETNFFDLEAPPLRICSLDLPVPFAPELENAYRPTLDSVIARIADWMG
ncbi:MAG: transketolase [Opitutaceae bacterium]|jgi:2-oxoisovalerate dehydrogenase E1 component|nr:transketolase [Opitutaceae bacterium]